MRNEYLEYQHTADELEEMPDLEQGYADDLKIRDGDVKIWLSRCTIADGEPFDRTVTVEVLSPSGRWYNAVRYDGDDPTIRLVGTEEDPIP